MFTTCDTEYNLDKHLISFLQDNPFFAEISRHIHKSPTKSISTAAVAFDEKADRKSTRLNSSHVSESRMPSSA